MSKSKARKSTAFTPSLKQIPENNYHDESDPFFMLPEVRESVERQDREYAEKQKELKEYRKKQLRERDQIRQHNEGF